MMDEDSGAYSGWAIIDFKRESIQAGVTPTSVAGEVSISMLGTVAMLRVISPGGEIDEWAPTLVAHIKYTNEEGVRAYLERPRGRRATPALLKTYSD